MPVFIELTTDGFAQNFQRQLDAADAARNNGARGAGTPYVRRPLRGIEIKEDTYAIIKVVTADGIDIPLYDSGARTGKNPKYSNFILQSVTESRMEKHQIVETFGDSYVFFFGEAPRFLDVQAVLLDTNDFNWQAEWWENYDKYLRGTRSVEMGARTYLFYNDTVVEGYIIQSQAANSAQEPSQLLMQFRLFVTNYQNVTTIGNPMFPVHKQFAAATNGNFDLSQPLSKTDLMDMAYGDAFSESALRKASTVAESPGPLRGYISDNTDEWSAVVDMGSVDSPAPPQTDTYNLQPEIWDTQGVTRPHEEVESLQQSTEDTISEETEPEEAPPVPPTEATTTAAPVPPNSYSEASSSTPDEEEDVADQMALANKRYQDREAEVARREQAERMNGLGLMPTFTPYGTPTGHGHHGSGASFGARASARASFGVRTKAKFKASSRTHVGASYSGGVGGGHGASTHVRGRISTFRMVTMKARLKARAG